MTGPNREPLSLAQLCAGQVGVLRSAPAHAIRLQELGLVPGQRVRVLRRGVFRGPLIVEVEGARVCLRSREAGLFQVQPE